MQKRFLLSTTAATALAIGCPSANAEVFRMTCTPASSSIPYTVAYDSDAGASYVTGSRSGTTRKYYVIDVKDKTNVHILYVATKAPGQTRTMYLAFDYSQKNDDVSAIRVINGASDNKDKCAFTPNQIAKATPQQGDVNALREQRSTADADLLRQENLRLTEELAKKEAEAAAKRQADAGAQADVNARSYTQQQIEAARQETLRLQQQQVQTGLTPQELQKQRQLQQKQHAEERVQGIVQANEAAEMKRILENYETASNAQTSVQMALGLKLANRAADAAISGRRITPEQREELLATAVNIEKKIDELKLTEAKAVETQQAAKLHDEMIQQKQAADEAAAKAKAAELQRVVDHNKQLMQQKQAADEATARAKADKELADAYKNADISADEACPADDGTLRPDGVGFATWLVV